ncbi:hypothetical protein OPV22_015738 [Ensete ventricosum]|uniref:UDP-glycosyltransferases domain-containing protein n=1 Tax=Ensete ventricosum TaxID=4639 RepID=A0AAV8R0T1_ENSVE|nr:hypothetical protein OPV22_015738 [Ensete ventricosum]
MGSSPHALLLPYPAQGHVVPLMALAHCLVDRGFKVTFVNTEFNHARLVAALADMEQAASGRIQLVSVPDGLDPEDSGARSNIGKLTAGLLKAIPPCLEELIRRSGDAGDQISCVIADQGMAWALEVAKKMGVRAAAFWPASAAVLATMLSIPELIKRGVIDANGLPMAEGVFDLGPGVLPMNTAYLGWNHLGDRTTQPMLFNYIFNNARATAAADFLLCNSFQELEAPVFAFAPSIMPIGPVRAGHRPGKLTGLKMVADESGIITREEISCKLQELLGDVVEVKKRAMALMEAAHRSATNGGSSFQNLTRFVAAMKE